MNDAPDLAAVTEVQQQIWSKGDFAMVANLVFNVSRGPRRGARDRPRRAGARRRLRQRQRRDRRGAAHLGNTVGADYVPALLERGRERAAAERLESSSSRPTPRTCPSRTASFDVAMSIFGAMFAPDQQKTAAELLRVVKPGGRIGMANWTPDGAVGEMFKTIAKHAPPPPGVDRRCSGAPRSACASCSATGSPTCGSSAASRASRSAPPTTTSSSSAPTSARPRSAYERVGAGGRAGADRRPARLPRGGEHRRRPRAGARGRVPAGGRDARLARRALRSSAAATTRIAAPIEEHA